MITRGNYLKKIKGIDLSKLDRKLKASKAYFDEITNNGTSWAEIENNPANEQLLEAYFKALEIALNKIIPQEKNTEVFDTKMRSVSSIKRTDPIVLELRFLRRYINLDGKTKKKRQIKLFLAALQRSIVSRQIRKTSIYADDIITLQDDLINLLESFKSRTKMRISISSEKENHILDLLGRQSEPEGIKLLKEFVKLQGKTISKKEIRRIHNKIGRYLNRKKEAVGSLRDSLSKKLLETTAYLIELYKGKAANRKIEIDNKTLNGIHDLTGIEDLHEINIEEPEKKKVYLQ